MTADGKPMSEGTDLLVPPQRLGVLLRQTRVDAGLDLAELSARSELLTMVDLDDLEHGRRTLDDDTLRHLVDLYEVPDVGLIPERSRLVIDLDEGRISIDHNDVEVGDQPPERPDSVLARYLALVYRLRGLPVGTPLGLRDIDLDVLARALALPRDEIEIRLNRLIDDEVEVETEQRSLLRRLLVPFAGVVVATTAVGTVLIVAENGAVPNSTGTATGTIVGTIDHDVAVSATIDVETDIGDPAVVEADRGTDIGEPAVVEAEPDTDIADAVIVEPGSEQSER